MGIIFQVMTDLVLLRVLQPRFQTFQHGFPVELLRSIGIRVSDRKISSVTVSYRKGEPDQFSLHVIDARRFRIKSGQLRSVYFLEPFPEFLFIQDRIENTFFYRRNDRCVGQGIQQSSKLEFLVQRSQDRDIEFAGPQRLEFGIQIKIYAYRCQVSGQ